MIGGGEGGFEPCGRMVPLDKCGYYEDRRPASNLAPYVVWKLLVDTTLLM